MSLKPDPPTGTDNASSDTANDTFNRQRDLDEPGERDCKRRDVDEERRVQRLS